MRKKDKIMIEQEINFAYTEIINRLEYRAGEIKSLEKRIWALENPSIYKYGDEVEFSLFTNSKVHTRVNGKIINSKISKSPMAVEGRYGYRGYEYDIDCHEYKRIITGISENNITKLEK